MAVGIVMAVVSVTVVLVLLSRMQNRHKSAVLADLADAPGFSKPPDILELVNQEVQEAGIDSLPGADGVDPTVLLKVWKRDGSGCAKGQGTFVFGHGITPNEATEDTLRFECGDNPQSESNSQATNSSAEAE